MRKRCFIIAILAAVCGAVFFVLAFKDRTLSEKEKRDAIVRYYMSMPEIRAKSVMEQVLEETNIFLMLPKEEESLDALMDKFGLTDPIFEASGTMLASYASFGLAGVLLLVGFIIGPPKKNYLVPLDEES